SDWIKIRSDDGFMFLIPRKAANCSGFLRGMLDSRCGFMESTSNTCQLIVDVRRAVVTEKVMEYLVFKAQYEKAGPGEDIPDFTERIVPELALETLMAADYLEA
ncbi:BTB/POZ protein, partial [Hysterangium stoloniferum]